MIYGPWNTVPDQSHGFGGAQPVVGGRQQREHVHRRRLDGERHTTGNVYVALGLDTPGNATTNTYTFSFFYSSTLGATFTSSPDPGCAHGTPTRLAADDRPPGGHRIWHHHAGAGEII